MSDATIGNPAAKRPFRDADDETPALNDMTFMQKTRGWVRLLGFITLTLVTIPVQWVLVRLRLPGHKSLPVLYHRTLCRIIGMRVKVTGTLEKGGGVLIAANHTSWLDIVTISTITPLSFIAKKQVDSWPMFGLMARLQRTIYVDRERRSKTAEQRDEIKDRLGEGDTIVLFPEGTSNDGNRILPFKSSLLSAAEGTIKGRDGVERPIRVQPVCVGYTRLQGLPMNRQYRPFAAWYGDMDLAPHLWDLLRLGPMDCEIALHPALTVEQTGSRKILAQRVEAQVTESLARTLAGRG
jgi:1-acyl-sn-glycerol-3-phosphate acyltransferase